MRERQISFNFSPNAIGARPRQENLPKGAQELRERSETEEKETEKQRNRETRDRQTERQRTRVPQGKLAKGEQRGLRQRQKERRGGSGPKANLLFGGVGLRELVYIQKR